MKKRPQTVWLAVGGIAFDDWDLPKKYRRVVEENSGSTPTSLLLPWPSVIMPEIGRQIDLSSMIPPYHEVHVDDLDMSLSASYGLTVYIETTPHYERTRDDNLDTLLCASQAGFCFESHVPIRSALKDAGLKYKRETG